VSKIKPKNVMQIWCFSPSILLYKRSCY